MANEQLPPEMMPEGAELPPEGVELPPEGAELPPEMMPSQLPPEMGTLDTEVAEEGIIDVPLQSDALEMDEEEAEESAARMIVNAKQRLWGEEFDSEMEVLQNSQNLVEDLAMICINILVGELEAADSSNRGIPFDYLMDVSAEVVSEAYDLAVQTGVYEPTSEEEVTRNQNISLTMVAGELGKSLGGDQPALPEEKVSGFMDDVMAGLYDDQKAQQTMMMPQMPPAPEGLV